MSDQLDATTPIVFERLIDATPDEAYALFTQPERLRRWQAVTAGVDLRVGGDLRMTVTPGHVARGTFTELEPGKRLAYTWGWESAGEPGPGLSDIVVEFEAAGDQTLVRMTHTGLTAEQGAGHTEGWNHFMDRLVIAAANGDAGFDPWAVGDELDALSAAEASWALCQQVMYAIGPEQRGLPTPCSDFTVHNLVEHLMESMGGLGRVVGSKLPKLIDAKSAEDYIGQAVEITLAAWREHGLDREVKFFGGMTPAAVPAGILSLELFVHGWDFARATGQDFEPTDALTAFVASVAEAVIKPGGRGKGTGFDHEVATESTDPVERLMAFTGRAV